MGRSIVAFPIVSASAAADAAVALSLPTDGWVPAAFGGQVTLPPRARLGMIILILCWFAAIPSSDMGLGDDFATR